MFLCVSGLSTSDFFTSTPYILACFPAALAAVWTLLSHNLHLLRPLKWTWEFFLIAHSVMLNSVDSLLSEWPAERLHSSSVQACNRTFQVFSPSSWYLASLCLLACSMRCIQRTVQWGEVALMKPNIVPCQDSGWLWQCSWGMKPWAASPAAGLGCAWSLPTLMKLVLLDMNLFVLGHGITDGICCWHLSLPWALSNRYLVWLSAPLLQLPPCPLEPCVFATTLLHPGFIWTLHFLPFLSKMFKPEKYTNTFKPTHWHFVGWLS